MPSVICPHCGKEHHADDYEVIICPEVIKYATCPQCSHVPSPADELCENCGRFLLEPSEVIQQSISLPADIKIQEQEKRERVQKKPPAKKTSVPVRKLEEKRVQEGDSIRRKQVSQKRIPLSIIFGLTVLFICAFVTIVSAAQLWQRPATPEAGMTEVVPEPPISQSTVTKISITATVPTEVPTETPVPTFTPLPTATVPSATPTTPVFAKITKNNLGSLNPMLVLDSPRGASDLAFSPDSHTLASTGLDGFLRIWDPYYGTLRMQLGENLRDLFTVAISPDGRTVVAGGGDFVLYSWDVFTGEEGLKYVGHSGWVNEVGFYSEDGKMISSSTSIILWNFETGKPLNSFSKNANDFAFTPPGDGLAVPDVIETSIGKPPKRQLIHSPVIRVLDINNGKTMNIYYLDVSITNPGAITSIEFSPDGEKIAAGGPEDSVWLGSARSSELKSLPQGESNAEITCMAFSPDSQILAVAYTDATVRLWDAKSGGFLSALQGHIEEVRSVVFSPDGTALASASDDDTIIIWRVR